MTAHDKTPIFYSPDQVVEITPLSRTEVMAAIHRGDLAAKRKGRLYFITRAAIESYIDSLPDA